MWLFSALFYFFTKKNPPNLIWVVKYERSEGHIHRGLLSILKKPHKSFTNAKIGVCCVFYLSSSFRDMNQSDLFNSYGNIDFDKFLGEFNADGGGGGLHSSLLSSAATLSPAVQQTFRKVIIARKAGQQAAAGAMSAAAEENNNNNSVRFLHSGGNATMGMGNVNTSINNAHDHVTKSLLLLQHRESQQQLMRSGDSENNSCASGSNNNNVNNNNNCSGINSGHMGGSNSSGMKSSVMSSKANGESVTLTVMRGEESGASRGTLCP
jgi:hypothetical protein